MRRARHASSATHPHNATCSRARPSTHRSFGPPSAGSGKNSLATQPSSSCSPLRPAQSQTRWCQAHPCSCPAPGTIEGREVTQTQNEMRSIRAVREACVAVRTWGRFACARCIPARAKRLLGPGNAHLSARDQSPAIAGCCGLLCAPCPLLQLLLLLNGLVQLRGGGVRPIIHKPTFWQGERKDAG